MNGNKKGGRCKPPLLTDPPKPEHSRGCVPATPGSQSCYLQIEDANPVPVFGQAGEKDNSLKIRQLAHCNFLQMSPGCLQSTDSHRCIRQHFQSLGESVFLLKSPAAVVKRPSKWGRAISSIPSQGQKRSLPIEGSQGESKTTGSTKAPPDLMSRGFQ
jgi:hypothetical protein